MSDIIERYNTIQKNIAISASKANRLTAEIELIAVSKNQPLDSIITLFDFGHRSFGENRLKEAKEHWESFQNCKTAEELKLHFIGHVQTNKADGIFELFNVIHSVDSVRLLEKFYKLEQKHNIKRQYFAQINIGREEQKSGVILEELDSFMKSIGDFPIDICGFMIIPPYKCDAKMFFSKLKELASKYNLEKLSMGMSKDYMDAIKYGATHIRVGEALFGARAST